MVYHFWTHVALAVGRLREAEEFYAQLGGEHHGRTHQHRRSHRPLGRNPGLTECIGPAGIATGQAGFRIIEGPLN